MENLNWQLILVFLSIAGASCYLLRNLYQFINTPASSGCGGGGCNGCDSNSVSQSSKLSQSKEMASGFVSLDSLTSSSHHKKV